MRPAEDQAGSSSGLAKNLEDYSWLESRHFCRNAQLPHSKMHDQYHTETSWGGGAGKILSKFKEIMCVVLSISIGGIVCAS